MLTSGQVAYLSPEGDPLWFTIGKGSEDLIPTGKDIETCLTQFH